MDLFEVNPIRISIDISADSGGEEKNDTSEEETKLFSQNTSQLESLMYLGLMQKSKLADAAILKAPILAIESPPPENIL